MNANGRAPLYPVRRPGLEVGCPGRPPDLPSHADGRVFSTPPRRCGRCIPADFAAVRPATAVPSASSPSSRLRRLAGALEVR
jgi:hypothetical protein